MKRAIVLAGGGSKGAYELGAWRALRELGITYDIVTGTSIGAVNGAVIVQDHFERLEELWRTITAEDIMKTGLNFDYSLMGILSQTDSIAAFVKNYVKNRGVDIEPFRKLLQQELNEDLFFSSPIEFGLMTVQVPSLVPIEITKAQIKPGQLVDWVLASASCFPAFPICEIEGKSYIDGGYYDNQPIDTAIRLGAEEIIAVGLDPKPIHPQYENNPRVTHIRPTRDLGSFLLFEHDLIQKNIALGYQDTMKVLGPYQGFGYTFTVQDPERFVGSAQTFLSRIMRIEAGVLEADDTMLNKTRKSAWLSECLNRVGEAKKPLDSLLCGIELFFELLALPREVVYVLEDVGTRLEQVMTSPQSGETARVVSRITAARRILKQNPSRRTLLELPPNIVIAALICEVL